MFCIVGPCMVTQYKRGRCHKHYLDWLGVDPRRAEHAEPSPVAVRAWRVPLRTTEPFCARCGQTVGHWPGCPEA